MARKPSTTDVPDPASPLEQPSAGGSYIRQPDGTLVREEYTRQPFDPDHGRELVPQPAPPSEEN